MGNDWPFGDDADRDDPLTERRIAVVSSFNPMWYYTCAFLNTNEDSAADYMRSYPFASSARPTEHEVLLLDSFRLHHRWYWSTKCGYNMDKLDNKPLDVDNTGASTVFIKYKEGAWGYRRTSWTHGPTFVPGPPWGTSKSEPTSLEQVMDRLHAVGAEYPSKDWLQWKADHPEVFEVRQ